MKVQKLTGAALDWAVAVCEGYHSITIDVDSDGTKRINYGGMYPEWSTDWAHGGPIIDAERFNRITTNVSGGYTVSAKITFEENDEDRVVWVHGVGETVLIAAMRCYVAKHLGEMFTIPEELT